MSVATSIGELWQAWLRVRQKWQTTKAVWLDDVERDFEREYWQALDSFMPQLKEHTDKLNKVIQDAHRNVH